MMLPLEKQYNVANINLKEVNMILKNVVIEGLY